MSGTDKQKVLYLLLLLSGTVRKGGWGLGGKHCAVYWFHTGCLPPPPSPPYPFSHPPPITTTTSATCDASISSPTASLSDIRDIVGMPIAICTMHVIPLRCVTEMFYFVKGCFFFLLLSEN